MTSAPVSRAEGAGRSVPAGPRDPSAAGVPAAPVAGGRAIIRGALWPVIVTAVWLLLAFRSQHVTYHLAPLLAAAAWPTWLRRTTRVAAPAGAALAATGGLAITLAGAFVLAVTSSLSGPSLWHGSGALESVAFATIGGAWGWRAATRKRPGVLGLVL